jgi:hypothetical protein
MMRSGMVLAGIVRKVLKTRMILEIEELLHLSV